MEKLTDISNIKYLLNIFVNKASAKKQFGQNFLTNEHVLAQIVEAAEINDKDTIIEIGPGLGVLTHELTQRAKKVTSIEMDREMVNILEKTLAREPTAKNLTIINQDALKFSPEINPLTAKPYKLVANLPYNVATAILHNFLVKTAYTQHQPTLIVVLVQKEVAEKACATTGDHNVLSLTLQPFASLKIISHVAPSSFYPAPKVTSSILKITPRTLPLLEKDYFSTYFKLIHSAFTQKRKTLTNGLQSIIPKQDLTELLTKAKIDPMARPQHLSIEQWTDLAKIIRGETLVKK